MTDSIVDHFVNRLENLFIEGLSKKGYSFVNKSDLEKFVKANCQCIDNEENKEKVYTVKGVPFLLHNYSMNISPVYEENSSIKIDADFGYYSFL